MLIGAHVSSSGGPAKAISRGEELGATSIQIFNQSPRAWKPRVYTDEEVAAFREAMANSPVDALVIHAVYLINCASFVPEIAEKSLNCLISALRTGAALGANAVILHPGSALKDTEDVQPAIHKAAETFVEALAESESCALHFENTAGAGGTLGRSFEELAQLIDLAGGDDRLSVCLDSCHLFASGYDIRTADGLTQVMDEFEGVVGLDRLGSLHVNDSAMPFDSNRDRHADLAEGELGREGCAAFLSEPRFQNLPCILETPGKDKKGATAADMKFALELRAEGLETRAAHKVQR